MLHQEDAAVCRVGIGASPQQSRWRVVGYGIHLLVHRANYFEDYALPKGAMEVLTMRAVMAFAGRR